MSAPGGPRRISAAVDRWLTAPEPNAAERLALFRVVYAAFYLWHLSFERAAWPHGLPATEWHRIDWLRWWPAGAGEAFGWLEPGLVAALCLLLAGLWTRWATPAVLFLGALHQGGLNSADIEHAPGILAIHIPLLVWLAGSRWGRAWSLDALLAARAGRPAGITAPHPLDAVPARALLVVLSAYFLSSAVLKVGFGGTWLEQPAFLGYLALEKNVWLAVAGLPTNPLAPLLATSPLVHATLRYLVIAFEAAFPLVLLGGRTRSVILSAALVFHAVSALWMGVTFTPVLVVYGLWVDWTGVARRLGLVGRPSPRVPTDVLVGGTLALAAGCALLWNSTPSPRAVLSLGGVVDWRTIWYPVLPLALGVLGRALAARPRGRRARLEPGDPPASH